MKKYILYILTGVAACGLCSCEDALDRYPKDRLTPDNFFHTEEECQLYTNDFYTMFPSAGTIYGETADIIAKTTLTSEVLGNRTVPATAGSWKWEKLRDINFFLQYSSNCADEHVRLEYEGVARFFPGVVLLREGEALRRRALGRPSDRRRRPAALRKGPRSARDGDAEGDRRPRFRRYQPARRKVGLPRDALGGAGAQEPRLPVRGNLPQVSRAEGLGKLSHGLRDGVEALHRPRADTRSTRRERRRISTFSHRSRPSTPKSCSPGPTTRLSV